MQQATGNQSELCACARSCVCVCVCVCVCGPDKSERLEWGFIKTVSRLIIISLNILCLLVKVIIELFEALDLC
jgi:hypothetical protein